MAACNHQCRSCRAEVQDLIYLCLLQVDNSLVYSLEKLTNINKNEHLPSHDLHIGQDVMYQDATSKWWYPPTITSLCVHPRSYNITTREGVTYRKTQVHLKPYQPQSKKSEDEHSDVQSSDMKTLKANHMQFDSVDSKNNQVQSYSRPKWDIKLPVKLDL